MYRLRFKYVLTVILRTSLGRGTWRSVIFKDNVCIYFQFPCKRIQKPRKGSWKKLANNQISKKLVIPQCNLTLSIQEVRKACFTLCYCVLFCFVFCRLPATVLARVQVWGDTKFSH
jgi:hypothetical protein